MTDTPDDELTWADARLLADLRGALGPDVLPAGFLERCEGLVAWMDVDDEVARLLERPEAELAGTRSGSDTAGAQVFELDDGSVSVEVDVGGDRITGQMLAGEPTAAVLERPGGEAVRAPIDELGRFELPTGAVGPVRIRLEREQSTPVSTDWFMI